MDIIGLGTYAIDVIHQVDTLPKADGFCIIHNTTKVPGGSGTNVIVQSARLGASCGYIAKIGNDDIGNEILKSLLSEGVDTDSIIVENGRTSLYTEIIVDENGEKFILLNTGDAMMALSSEEVNRSALLSAKVFYTDLIPGPAACSTLACARANGVKTAFNMQVSLPTMEGFGITKDTILDALKNVDVFAPCREGLYGLAGTDDLMKCHKYIRKYFKEVLLVTLGAKGSIAFDADDNYYKLPSREIKPVDTTGAGDSYMGAFIKNYFIDKKPIQESMEFATMCAAYTCCSLGARSTPNLEQINEWLGV